METKNITDNDFENVREQKLVQMKQTRDALDYIDANSREGLLKAVLTTVLSPEEFKIWSVYVCSHQKDEIRKYCRKKAEENFPAEKGYILIDEMDFVDKMMSEEAC